MREADTIELRWFLAVIRRRAALIVGCTLLALVVAIGVTSRMPPVYEATVTLLVVAAEDMKANDYNALIAGERLALTYGQMLKEQSTLQTAISWLGLRDTPETLAKRIKIEPVRDTQLVRVRAQDSSQARVALLANTIAEAFVAYARTLQDDRYRSFISSREARIEAQRILVEQAQSKIDAVDAKSSSDEAELARLQGLLAEYRSNQRALEQDSQSLQLLSERARDSVKVAETARVSPTSGRGRVTAVVTLLVGQGDPDVATSSSGAQTSERLAATYAQMAIGQSVLEAAAAKLGPGQSVDALAKTVTAAPVAGTQLVRLQVTGTVISQTVSAADAIAQAFVDQVRELQGKPYAVRLASMQDQNARLSALIDNTQAEIQARTLAKFQNERELTRLQSELAEYRSDYRVSQQDYEQARLTETQAPDTVVITERAREPERPVSTRALYVLLVALVAILVAFGIAFLIEYLDESIKTPDDVSHVLGLSTVGMIEQLGKEGQKLIVASQPQSPAAEAFRVLASHIRLSSIDSHLRTILVTSPAPAEGKSVVAANLAVAMAGTGQRVVVVDADLRLPRLHQLFELSRGPGLTDALWQESISGKLKPTSVDGVRILTSGTASPDPVEALSSPQMMRLLTDLAKEADFVIVDAPPVLAVADATIIAAGTDGVLLVLRAGNTGGRSARRAVEALRRTRTQLIGVVLNAVPVHSEGYYRYATIPDSIPVPRTRTRKVPGLFSRRQPRQSGQR
jgi:polysaccharide biosynthesis transport protein